MFKSSDILKIKTTFNCWISKTLKIYFHFFGYLSVHLFFVVGFILF